MRKLFLSTAMVLALASCGAPAYAQQTGCVALENLLPHLDEVPTAGGRVLTLHGDEAQSALAAVVDAVGEPPRRMDVTAVIMVFGDRGAMLLFVEREGVCLRLPLPLAAAEKIERAALGRAV